MRVSFQQIHESHVSLLYGRNDMFIKTKGTDVYHLTNRRSVRERCINDTKSRHLSDCPDNLSPSQQSQAYNLFSEKQKLERD